jgi:hypothetical protein
MVKTKTVQQEELATVLREWLANSGQDSDVAWELFFLQNEVILRPKPEDETDLDAWWMSFKAQYDETLQKLARA